MKPRILVVEDQEVVREQICDFLEWTGCEIIGTAVNGREAVEKYASLSPELVTMDLMMPVMNGVEATREILSGDPGARILVFTSLDTVGSGNGDESGMVKQALDCGAVAAVCKFSKTGIADELKKAFGDRIDL